MRTGAKKMNDSPSVSHPISAFLEEMAGASMYEFALLASLVAVVSIIILIALNLA
jgi:Flp pilus assembly pilin Flp